MSISSKCITTTCLEPNKGIFNGHVEEKAVMQAMAWINLGNFILRKNQTKTYQTQLTYCINPFKWNIQNTYPLK